MGLAVANASDASRKIVAELDRLTSFLCVIFFVVHSAELDLSAFAEAGFIGVAYIVLRSAGKYAGIFVSARMADEPASVQNWGGAALVAQAGAAIALSTVAADRNPELGGQLQTIILGTVVFFEIAGPLLIRQAVLRSGEVPLAHAVRHSSSTLLEELRALTTRILVSLGYDPLRKRKPDELLVNHFVRRNVAVLNESSTFDEVVKLIAHSHDNSYPVLDNDSCLVGVVRYTDLSQVLFDREVTRLVYATDLARPVKFRLHPDDSISKALRRLHETKDDSVVVVDPEEPHTFVGLVRRRDLTTYLLRQQEASEESET